MFCIEDLLTTDYDIVSYRLTTLDWKPEYVESEITALNYSFIAGNFKIKNGQIIPLDSNTYSKDDKIIWHQCWSTNDKKGITIIVEEL